MLKHVEKRLLGSFVVFPESFIPGLIDIFQHPTNKHIYQTMSNLDEFDVCILADKLHSTFSHSYELVSGLLQYAAFTKHEFLKKDIDRCITWLTEEAIKDEVATGLERGIITTEDAQERLGSIRRSRDEDGRISIKSIMEMKSGEGMYDTGIPYLDRRIGGLMGGDVVTIMARPGVGKSWLMMNIMGKIVERHPDAKVAFFSFEGGRGPVSERLLQGYFRVARNIVTPQYLEFNPTDMEEFEEVYKNAYLFTDGYSLEEIRAKIGVTQAQVAFIDFLDLISTRGQIKPYERISEIILRLKQIASKHNVLLFIAHQLSRAAEDGSMPVKLHHGRDSGKIEENSDFIIGAWRPEISDDAEEFKSKITLALLKNKRGPGGTITCQYNPDYWKIMEIE